MRIGCWLVRFSFLLGCPALAPAVGLSPFDDVAQVSAGNLHSCARTTPGAVWCWGTNGDNQLGLGEDSSPTSRLTPVPVPGLLSVRSVASGHAHNCVITNDRSVQCWGLNFAGQAGDPSLRYSIGTPTTVSGLSGPVFMLALGGVHSCALIEGGRVECWGDDSHGQLGDGSPGGARASAAAVQQLGGIALSIAAGDSHTCALLASGSVRCWGLNEVGQLGDNTTSSRALPVSVQGLPGAVRRIATASASSCAITQAGALFCWGPQYPLLAFEGGSLVARAYPGFGSGGLEVTAGSAFFCVLSGGNQIRCFGENAFGQFGTGPVDGSLGVDAAVDLAVGIEDIEAGSNHTCARSATGGLQCWGDNRFGQLGIDSTSLRLVPTQVTGLTSGIVDVGIGNYHGCALTTAGAVKCWGANGAQQVGDGTTDLRLNPVDVPGLSSGVRALDVGANSSCVINAQRRVQCWGANFGGQLGNGGSPDTAPPGAVLGLGEVNVLAVGVGNDHACALLDGGTVKCWGSNDNGQLGDGTTQRRDSAVDVVGLGSGVKAIGVGYFHTCAITAGNGMKCWGLNDNGQLGDGSTTQRLSPVDVLGLSSGVTAIGPGGLHTCAVANGGVKCWGANFFGLLLGDGSETDRSVPADVPALRTGVRELAVSLFGSCALLDSGALRCWGDSGIIGDNSNLGRPLPTEPSGLGRGVSAADTGYGLGGHACAVRFGAAKCWGENTFATLGDGTTHGVPTAQTVLSNQIRRRVAALAAARSAGSDEVQLDASGRFVLLVSEASNLTPGDSNGAADVFVFDRERRVARRVSVDDAGAQIAGASRSPSMSANGGLVAFVAPDAGVGKLRGESAKQAAARRKANGESVYLHNLLTGSTQQVGSSASADPSPQISADGSTIVYTAPVTDDSEGTVGQDNLYVVEVSPEGGDVALSEPVCTTCKPTSTSGSSGLAKADGASGEPVLSADGQWLAYTTEAKNGVANQASPCPTAGTEVLLQNLLTGSTQRISPPPGTSSSQCGTLGSSSPSIDYAGNTIALQSDQPLDADDANGLEDIYVFSTTDSSVLRVSEGAGGVDGNGASSAPKLSGDGAHVAFVSSAGNLDASFADNNDTADVHTVALGGTPTRLSLSATGAEANAASASPALNFDGSQVAFLSSASLLTGSTGSTSVLTRDNPAAPSKRSATWWIPAESGWGLTVFDQGSVLTPTWFTYDSDGEPTWFLVAGAFPQTDGSFTGEVYRFKGTPLAQISGEAATSVVLAGTSRLTYVGEDVLNFQYTVDGFNQTKVLRRFPFGARSFTCNASPELSRASADNYTDLWSGATPNAGWGLTLFHIDDLLVAIWYTYDTDGEAVFFVINANRQSDGTFSGEIFRQRNGVPFSQIDGALPSADADVVGTASFRFLDGERAEFSYVMGLTVQTRAIERLVVGDVTQVCRTASVGGD